MPDAKTSNLEFRERQTTRYGARAMDQIFCELCCKECGASIVDPGVRPVEYVDYGTHEELVESVTRAVKAVTPPPVSCVQCSGKPKIVHLDYHCFSTALGRDVVVRDVVKGGLLGGYKTEFYTWSVATGYLPLDPLPPEMIRRFGRDAAVRKGWTQIEVSGVKQAYAQLETLATQLAGDKALLDFLPPLLSAGKAALAARIAQSHVDSWPNDPAGHYWLAEILIQAIAHGAVNVSRLDDAARLLDRAIAADGGHGPALVARANLPRIRGDNEAAYQALSELAAQRPDLADAHFHLGVMVLDQAPAKALEHFQAAEAASPGEADYVIGRARALLKLGRQDEAREAAKRGKELSPEHPRLKELERLVGR
ncbi:MAG: tetratricopeptide repeat protein [Deltaproteobacteria bacterium]|nr:tetratricopeptide repeat protein [Deltaproteobacteria bacterium]